MNDESRKHLLLERDATGTGAGACNHFEGYAFDWSPDGSKLLYHCARVRRHGRRRTRTSRRSTRRPARPQRSSRRRASLMTGVGPRVVPALVSGRDEDRLRAREPDLDRQRSRRRPACAGSRLPARRGSPASRRRPRCGPPPAPVTPPAGGGTPSGGTPAPGGGSHEHRRLPEGRRPRLEPRLPAEHVQVRHHARDPSPEPSCRSRSRDRGRLRSSRRSARVPPRPTRPRPAP